MPAMRPSRPYDEGMTLIEILFASIILFFAITAILGLLAASTRINVQATQQVITVNRVQSYVEDVRRLGYDEVGVVGGPVAGSLDAVSHFSSAGWEVTITPTVTWVDDPRIEGEMNYKKLRVVATSVPTGGTGTPYTYNAETYIRQSDSNRPEDAAPPEIEFQTGSPASMQVVSGTAVMIYAHAWSPMTNGLLQNLRYYCEGRALRNSSTPPGVAEWSLEQQDAVRSFGWDTTKIDEDGRPFSADGVRQIKIQTWDNIGQTTYRIRQVIVDNYAPLAPASMTPDTKTDILTRLTWPASMDGPTIGGVAPDPSYGYLRHIHTESKLGWTQSDYYVGNVIFSDQATTPFTRYRACVYAVSPGGRYSPRTGSDYYISRSRLTGTWTNTNSGSGAGKTCTTNLSFTLGQPTFNYASVTNTLYRSTSPDMSSPTVVTTGTGWATTTSYTTVVGSQGVPTPYYYQVISQIKPSGEPSYASNAIVAVKSNIIGPVGSTANGTLATAGW